MKNNRKVSLKIFKLDNQELISYAKLILANLKDNPHFSGTIAGVPEIEKATEAFEKAIIEAADGAKTKLVLRNDARDNLSDILNLLARNIEIAAKGNLDAIHSVGLELSKKNAVGVKSNYWVKQAKESGKVYLKTIPVKGKVVYFWEYSTDNQKTWLPLLHTTDSKVLVGDLTEGLRYHFRNYYIDSEGKHAYTEPLSILVV